MPISEKSPSVLSSALQFKTFRVQGSKLGLGIGPERFGAQGVCASSLGVIPAEGFRDSMVMESGSKRRCFQLLSAFRLQDCSPHWTGSRGRWHPDRAGRCCSSSAAYQRNSWRLLSSTTAAIAATTEVFARTAITTLAEPTPRSAAKITTSSIAALSLQLLVVCRQQMLTRISCSTFLALRFHQEAIITHWLGITRFLEAMLARYWRTMTKPGSWKP